MAIIIYNKDNYDDGAGVAHRRGERLSPRLQLAVFLRSLALQAAWNPQRMQNLGLLVALLPWVHQCGLRLTERRRFCRRYYGFFNTNPYLANFILGGILRLEAASGEQGPADDLLCGFKDSLARSFASLGDQLFWLGLQPALVLLAGLLGLFGGPWPVLGVFALFAAAEFVLRYRSLAVGHRLGLEIVELLSRAGWHHLIRWTQQASLVLAGIWCGCWLTGLGAGADRRTGLAMAVALLGGIALPLGLRKRSSGEGLVLLVLLLALAISYI
jgi:PTS system mannose-specific IID component